ncbi:hypothetical protein PUN28_005405 [Cardiocondyla obscurior]|uniref:Uncharacterized protein n=1 Tax=Cardiocondyla obscurior TaxID=286306 RepID=A0AAW2GKV9_9HYME
MRGESNFNPHRNLRHDFYAAIFFSFFSFFFFFFFIRGLHDEIGFGRKRGESLRSKLFIPRDFDSIYLVTRERTGPAWD